MLSTAWRAYREWRWKALSQRGRQAVRGRNRLGRHRIQAGMAFTFNEGFRNIGVTVLASTGAANRIAPDRLK
jgi:hypothetical protein